MIKDPSKVKHDSEASSSGYSNQAEGSISSGYVSDSEVNSTGQEEQVGFEQEVNTSRIWIINYFLERVRKRNETKLPSKFDYYNFLVYTISTLSDIEADELKSYLEALKSKERDRWVQNVMRNCIHVT